MLQPWPVTLFMLTLSVPLATSLQEESGDNNCESYIEAFAKARSKALREAGSKGSLALPLKLGHGQQDSRDSNRKDCNTAFPKENSKVLREASNKAASNKEASTKEEMAAPAQLGHDQNDSSDNNRRSYRKAFAKSFSKAFLKAFNNARGTAPVQLGQGKDDSGDTRSKGQVGVKESSSNQSF